jgi:predicted PurR-regulated permease PerM
MLAAVVGVVYLGYVTRLVTVPVMLAMALAYMFEPLVLRAVRGGRMSRQGAATIILLLAVMLGVVPAVIGLTFGTIQAAQGVQELAKNTEWLVRSIERPEDTALANAAPGSAWRDIRDWTVEQQARARDLEKAREEYRQKEADAVARRAAGEAVPPADPHAAEPPAPGPLYQATSWVATWLQNNRESLGKKAIQAGAEWANGAVRAVWSLGFLAFSAFLTGFFFYFFCTGYGRVVTFWEGLIPERQKPRVLDLARQMDAAIAGFIRGRLTICACLMVWYTLGYGLIGVPGFLIMGPIVGVLSLLPYAAGLGAPVAMVLMWLDPDGGWQNAWWWVLGAPIGVSLVAQVLDDYVLTPAIQGKSTGMDMPTILFASLAGGVLAGVYGLLIAIPTAACIKILLREVFLPRFKAWASGRASDFLPLEKE